MSAAEDNLEQPKRPSYFVNAEEQPLISTADFKHVLPVGEQWDHTPESEHRFGIRYTMLAPIVGASNLGTSYCELPPKKASWPFHYHLNNEEAVYILEGTGVMCVPEGDFPVKKGDYIHFRAGKEFAHRLVNPSEETTLRYLCFSTLNRPDVAVYPSTGKLGIFDFQHGLGMRFHGLNDSGLPYYQPTGAAGSAYLAQAHRSPTTRAFDMECEKPQEEEQPAAQE